MKYPTALLLDRDGVINHDSPDYILTPEQWNPIAGSLEAIARITKAGIPIAICSNQSALARGMLDWQTFRKIHAKMLLLIEEAGGMIQHVIYCPHGPDENCRCRKPLPGMLKDALLAMSQQDHPQTTVMIGDSLRDVQAARAAGTSAIFVRSGCRDSDAIQRQLHTLDDEIMTFSNLAEAVDSLLSSSTC
ncbi:MAG: HAD-IIIA family hydrolase [Mariprofundaceae bacterium]